MSWENMLKMPFVDYIDSQGGTKDNPIVFVDTPTELKGENFDEKYLTQWYKTTTFFHVEGAELSNLGRVRINNKIIKPEKSSRSNKMVTKVKGYGGGEYKPNRHMSSRKNRYKSGYQPKAIADSNPDKLRTRSIPYTISASDLLRDYGDEMDKFSNAEVFIDGNSAGMLKDYLPQLEYKRKANQWLAAEQKRKRLAAERKEKEEGRLMKPKKKSPNFKYNTEERLDFLRRRLKNAKKNLPKRAWKKIEQEIKDIENRMSNKNASMWFETIRGIQ